MLRIYDVIVTFLGELRPLIEGIARHDRDLADQARRAGASIALNAAEGSGARGRNRGLRYATALGSAREVRAALHVAQAFGYLEVVDAPAMGHLDHIIGTLVKVTRRG
jgi:four helix bundle protein